MKEISIVLTQTNTIISKTLKAFSKKPYNHISISLTDDCSTMYSFGRKIMWCPLIGGFVKEDINSGVFKMHPETKCKIYKLEVTDSEYNIIMKRLNRFIDSPNNFRYGILNVFLMYFNVAPKREYCYVCSSFVSYLLWGIIPLKKEVSLVTPDDYNSMDLKTIYEGKLHDYVKNNNTNSSFANSYI
ncbi:hypothetical protein J2Z76_002121 [Sedimentibacter acidaminivorans]|jgi:hypothetical protein|uniref:Uncharacterized protein n=1 Tax=Sedimentibacter acidaminivorans TaxID=913099 RepID=A0ABS4GEY7_9FIRM|nr:hypothetical protein [Sedimentibacter acidaminivorans]MBP1926256.1 hypothetical protein [Sedimentibacter acidaminivorans]